MKIHEYQAKALFAEHGIPVPRGGVATDIETALSIAEGLDGWPVVVKAQIHAGGRGKGGGVKLAHNLDEVASHARQMLGMTLVTPQTGTAGRVVNKILVEQGLDIARELYLALVPDRATAQIVIMASLAGGMDIEEVAAASPEKIIRVGINPLAGIQPYHCRAVAFGLGLPAAATKQVQNLLPRLYRLFTGCDCSLLEINPLVVTREEMVIALDGKATFDDNALFRHPEITDLRDPAEEDPLEAKAREYGLNYINLGGNVGNMVNGAGLAMATMDLIKAAGAAPANFLDVGGGANAEMVENGFKLILRDPQVKGVLINIFGGILRCDVLAEGVVRAARNTGIAVPVVIRMEGTNVEEGRRILAESGLNLTTAADLREAARMVSEMVG